MFELNLGESAKECELTLPSPTLGKLLASAIMQGNKQEVEKLLCTVPALLKEKIAKGLTPLALAINANQEEIVKFLLASDCTFETGNDLYPDAEDYATFWGKQNLVILIKAKKEALNQPKKKIQCDEILAHRMQLEEYSRLTKNSTFIGSLKGEVQVGNENIELIPISTLGRGDCAFHAVFGEWNENLLAFACDNVITLRKTVAEAIRKCAIESHIFQAVKEAIQQIIISEREGGNEIPQIRKDYQNYLKENQKLIKSMWDNFQQELIKYSTVLEYINKHTINILTKEEKHLDTLQRQFNQCLNVNDGELYGIILSIEELNRKFKEYNCETNKDFDLDRYLNNPKVLDEYAQIIERSGSWLLPGELEIIARVLDKTIELYITDGNTKEKRKIEVYNFNEHNHSVAIYFNGVNHYERMLSSNESLLLNQRDNLLGHGVVSIVTPVCWPHAPMLYNYSQYRHKRPAEVASNEKDDFNQTQTSNMFEAELTPTGSLLDEDILFSKKKKKLQEWYKW